MICGRKCVVLGISGGIAAYKACEIVSRLNKLNYSVKVIMTKNATEFITPLTLETLSNNKVICDMFEEKKEWEIEHIALAKQADIFVVAPATANVIAKLARGIADDFLSTTFLATTSIKIICPAMNTNMYESDITKENIDKLRTLGCIIVEPDSGFLACGDKGKGRMCEPVDIVSKIDSLLTPKADFRGKNVLITAGATIEKIDSVRYISNFSSGKMGVALAQAVIDRGGTVTLIIGKINVDLPKDAKIIRVESTQNMYEAVMNEMENSDIIIKAAAPSDYRVKNFSIEKIKAEELTLELEKNVDIATEIGKKKGSRKLIVFAAETNDLLKNAKQKLEKKNADMIVANDVTKEGAGFNVDTNIVTILKRNGKKIALQKMSKRELSDIILDNIID